MSYYEERQSRETIFRGHIFSVHRDTVRLDSGGTADRELVEHHGGVGVLALDEEGRVLLVRQYRYAAGRELLELPAGKLNEGEDPLEGGRRELEEETGYRAEHLTLLTEFFPTPGYVSERVFVYHATGLSFVGQHLDDGEFLDVARVPLKEALAMCRDGRIRDGKTLIGLLLYAQGAGQTSDISV